MKMNKVLSWEFAGKVAVIFGILGGIYLFISLFQHDGTTKYKFESLIYISSYDIPSEKRVNSYYTEINKLIPSTLTSFSFSMTIMDSLEKICNISRNKKYNGEEFIRETIESKFNRDNLINKIDSILLDVTYPMRRTYTYISTSINNKGDDIVKNLRFELPGDGYFELFENNAKISKGEYNSNIFIGDLRPANVITLNIWSFNFIDNYNVADRKIKYTFDKGSVTPTTTELIKAKGFYFWIYKNKFSITYSLIAFPISFMLVFLLMLLNTNKPEKEESDTNQNESK
jgi:hypothetical protein